MSRLGSVLFLPLALNKVGYADDNMDPCNFDYSEDYSINLDGNFTIPFNYVDLFGVSNVTVDSSGGTPEPIGTNFSLAPAQVAAPEASPVGLSPFLQKFLRSFLAYHSQRSRLTSHQRTLLL